MALAAFLAVVSNIVLNIILIPKFNIMGAAFATLLSYLVLLSVTIFFSFKEIQFSIPYKEIFIYFGSSIIMSLVINLVMIQSIIPRIFLKIGIGIIIYALLILLFDIQTRQIIFAYVSKIGSSRI